MVEFIYSIGPGHEDPHPLCNDTREPVGRNRFSIVDSGIPRYPVIIICQVTSLGQCLNLKISGNIEFTSRTGR